MASRLLCLTRSRLGGAQTPSIASTGTPSPSSTANIQIQPPLQTTAVESLPQNPPTTVRIGAATQMPVAATVVEPAAEEPRGNGEVKTNNATYLNK